MTLAPAVRRMDCYWLQNSSKHCMIAPPAGYCSITFEFSPLSQAEAPLLPYWFAILKPAAVYDITPPSTEDLWIYVSPHYVLYVFVYYVCGPTFVIH